MMRFREWVFKEATGAENYVLWGLHPDGRRRPVVHTKEFSRQDQIHGWVLGTGSQQPYPMASASLPAAVSNVFMSQSEEGFSIEVRKLPGAHRDQLPAGHPSG